MNIFAIANRIHESDESSGSKHGKPVVQRVGEGGIMQTRGNSVAHESDEASGFKHGKPVVQRVGKGGCCWLSSGAPFLDNASNANLYPRTQAAELTAPYCARS